MKYKYYTKHYSYEIFKETNDWLHSDIEKDKVLKGYTEIDQFASKDGTKYRALPDGYIYF